MNASAEVSVTGSKSTGACATTSMVRYLSNACEKGQKEGGNPSKLDGLYT